MQRRIRSAEADVQTSQREYEDRIRDQNKTINHLQADLDNLDKMIHEKSEEGIQIYEQIQIIKRQIEERICEIQLTTAELESVKIHNDQLRREIE